MSVPGPPPNGNPNVPAAGGTPAYWKHSSDKSSGFLKQDVLTEVADLLSQPHNYVVALALLRAYQRAKAGHVSTHAELKQLGKTDLGKRVKAVLRRPRFSEIAIQLGSKLVAANPEHLDVDWFGDPPLGHWWNSTIKGSDMEKSAVEGWLDFTKHLLGLGGSPWFAFKFVEWPGGELFEPWVDAITRLDKFSPIVSHGSGKVTIEWHEGVSSGPNAELLVKFNGQTCWFETPMAQGPDSV